MLYMNQKDVCKNYYLIYFGAYKITTTSTNKQSKYIKVRKISCIPESLFVIINIFFRIQLFFQILILLSVHYPCSEFLTLRDVTYNY